MKKLVIIYGLIAGTIVAAMMLITMPMYQSGKLKIENGELLGYSTMVIALSVIFFAVKSYRDKQSSGTITFLKGLKIGLLITLIAGVMYASAWEYMYPKIGEDFIATYQHNYFEEMKAKGASDADIQTAKADMASFTEAYKNPIVRFSFTLFVEIFPVGLIISLLTAILLRKKEFLPATEPASAQ